MSNFVYRTKHISRLQKDLNICDVLLIVANFIGRSKNCGKISRNGEKILAIPFSFKVFSTQFAAVYCYYNWKKKRGLLLLFLFLQNLYLN